MNTNHTTPTPILSIITVVKNNPQDLCKTIENVAHSIYLAFCEHLIIDASSQETIFGYASLLKQTHIRHIISQDRSIYEGMNLGIMHAKGAWLWFINSGDLVRPSSQLTDILTHATMEKKPLIIAPTIEIWREQEVIRTVKPLDRCLVEMPTSHQGMVFFSGLHKAFLYNTNYKICADFELFMKLNINADKIYKVSEPIACTQAEGYSSRNWMLMLKEKKRILQSYETRITIKIRYFFYFLTNVCKKALRMIIPKSFIKYMRAKVHTS